MIAEFGRKNLAVQGVRLEFEMLLISLPWQFDKLVLKPFQKSPGLVASIPDPQENSDKFHVSCLALTVNTPRIEEPSFIEPGPDITNPASRQRLTEIGCISSRLAAARRLLLSRA